jgi:hypothetical protein
MVTCAVSNALMLWENALGAAGVELIVAVDMPNKTTE